ncbi:bb in a boxcar [Anaeramoeba flamelloides]|uniref:Bb in a boxcar n=1 Tax=Anaeramoeba flamelloides TaxID=1746091 RepID=A0ABQ8XWF6_9EUKA|nr:bb in a boxcar [Anaeramoeba flamelloides]
MDETLPRYVTIFSPLTIAFYYICDNCDGKQARKTDNASPLGQLFDHGIDCVVGLFVIQNTATTLGVGNSMAMYFVLLETLGGFYMTTWEEYCCEKFYLGVINGADEGNLFSMLLNLSVVIKPDLFSMFILNKKVSDLVIPPMLIMIFPVLIGNFIRVKKCENLKKYGLRWVILTTIPNIVVLTIVIAWRILNPSIFESHLRIMWNIVGFLFANINFRVLLAHLTQNFKYWYMAKRLWILFLLPPLYYLIGYNLISEISFLYAYVFILGFAFIHMFYSISIDVSSFLKIKVFKNKPPINLKKR